MALSLGFLLRADTEQAEAAIKKLESTGERVAAGLEGNFASASSGIASGIAGIAPAVGIAAAAVTVLGGTILALAHRAAEYGDKIYEASLRTGLSARQLSGLAAATRETGENFDSLTVALGRAERNIGEALINPVATSSKVILELAGGADNLRKIIHEPGGTGDAIALILKRIYELHTPTERAVALTSIFGRGWQQNTLILRELAENGYGPAIAKAKEFGLLVDDKQAAQAHVFTEEMNRLKAQLEGLAVTAGNFLIPKMEKFLAILDATKVLLQTGGVGAGLAYQVYLQDIAKQQEKVNAAVAAMQEPVKNAGVSLDNLTKKSDDFVKVLAKEAYYTELATTKFSEWGAVIVSIESRFVDMRKSHEEYIKFLEESMHKQAEDMEKRREEAAKPLEAPDIGVGGLSPETLGKISEANQEIIRQQQQNKNFTDQAAESWRQYLQIVREGSNALDQLGAAVHIMIQAHEAGLPVIKAFWLALRDEGEAAEESAKKQIEAQAKSLLSHILSRKAMAIVEAAVQTAQGIADLAFPPKPWSAALHFLSAAEWAVVAGTSGGAKGGAGGGTGGGGQRLEEGGVGAGRGVVGLGGVVGGGGGRSVTTSINIYGGQITDTHNLQNLVATLNSGGGAGTIRLNTGGSAYSIPNPAY